MDISYKGTHYHGWQVQPNGITIQEEIENALSSILKAPHAIVGSGRTDTGVHAVQQIAHFDSASTFECEDLVYKLNSFLKEDIAIQSIKPVSEEVHARFSAVSRTYQYKLHQKKDPFIQGQSYYFRPKLDITKINEACKLLVKWENFECFSKVHTEVNHFRCDITFAKWYKTGPENLFVITADRFLRGMVRAVVGTLINVGLQKTSLEGFKEILTSNDRSKAGRAVPADGLFLLKVVYPEDIYLL